jgi:hypothetical protein
MIVECIEVDVEAAGKQEKAEESMKPCFVAIDTSNKLFGFLLDPEPQLAEKEQHERHGERKRHKSNGERQPNTLW